MYRIAVFVTLALLMASPVAGQGKSPKATCATKTERQWRALEPIAKNAPVHLRLDWVQCAILRCLKACEKITLIT